MPPSPFAVPPMPPDACDAHVQLHDRRFAAAVPERVLDGCTADDYRALQAVLGTARAVVATPAACGTDNAVTLDAIRRLGPQSTRGLAVLHPEADDAALDRLHAGGIRGLRFALADPASAVTRVEMVEPLARRCALLGWHVQLDWRADQIVAHARLLERLPCGIVFEHLGRLPAGQGVHDPAFAVVERLLRDSRAWAVLSADSADDELNQRVVQALLAIAPGRLLWASGWPGPTGQPVDDLAPLAALARWVPDAAQRQRILVDNPQALYGFAARRAGGAGGSAARAGATA
jgi:predicted TIM-barrel fold metal-dependent hydrolase